jgi:hypothetical protein
MYVMGDPPMCERSQPGHFSPVRRIARSRERESSRENAGRTADWWDWRRVSVPGLGVAAKCPGNAQRAADHLRSTVFGAASVVAECDTAAATTVLVVHGRLPAERRASEASSTTVRSVNRGDQRRGDG